MLADKDYQLKVGLAEMLKGGVIMDVTNAEQAKIAEDAGAVAVMALERVPADIRKAGGVARMAAIEKIEEIQRVVQIPVMAKCRIGHFAEAELLQELKVDFIDESEVLTPADEENHIEKHPFKIPFVCGCRNLGEAMRRINEGAAMIRTKGEAGSGNIVEAVRHLRMIYGEIAALKKLNTEKMKKLAKEMRVPVELIEEDLATWRPARTEFCCRWSRHACRRSAVYEATCAGGVCRLWYFQVIQSASRCQSYSDRCRPL